MTTWGFQLNYFALIWFAEISLIYKVLSQKELALRLVRVYWLISIFWLVCFLQVWNLTPLALSPHSAKCCCSAWLRPEAKVAWLCGSEPVLVRYHSLKCWAVSRSQVRQFVLLTTQWTCFIGTLLEVSSNWRPELWGSGPLPSFSWRVNYTVGGAGGLSQGWGAEIVAQQHVKGVCGLRAEIHLTIVSRSSP